MVNRVDNYVEVECKNYSVCGNTVTRDKGVVERVQKRGLNILCFDCKQQLNRERFRNNYN